MIKRNQSCELDYNMGDGEWPDYIHDLRHFHLFAFRNHPLLSRSQIRAVG